MFTPKILHYEIFVSGTIHDIEIHNLVKIHWLITKKLACIFNIIHFNRKKYTLKLYHRNFS